MNKEWYAENKDRLNEKRRERYAEKNKDKPPRILKSPDELLKNNKDHRKKYIAEYRQNNKDKPYYQYDKEYQKVYREKKKLEKQQKQTV
jgi:hypothetical protein